MTEARDHDYADLRIRVAALEAGRDHLATSADIERLRSEIASLRAELHSLGWRLMGAGVAVGLVILGVARWA